MKIVIALTKPHLADAVSSVIPKSEDSNFAFTDQELSKNLTRIGKDIDYLIVHEDIYSEKYPWEWLSFLKSSVSEKTKIIVILSEQTDSLYREMIKRISVDLIISLIPSALTAQELAEEVEARLFNKEKEQDHGESGRVVTMLSASPKDGATTIAISTALCMALRTPDKKFLLVDLNLKSPEIRDHLHLTSDRGYPLIQADCDSGTLESTTLMRACDHIKGVSNLYILTGIQRREWAEKIRMEEVEHLLKVARNAFDFIILDVHTYPDQAATLKCVKEADERLVIVQPIITSYQSSWNDWYNSVWQHYGLSESNFQLVMNRDMKIALEGFQIEKSMGTKIVARIRNVDKGAGIKAINFGQPLYLNDGEESTDFKEDILNLCTWLADRAKIDLQPLPTDRKKAMNWKRASGFFGSIFK